MANRQGRRLSVAAKGWTSPAPHAKPWRRARACPAAAAGGPDLTPLVSRTRSPYCANRQFPPVHEHGNDSFLWAPRVNGLTRKSFSPPILYKREMPTCARTRQRFGSLSPIPCKKINMSHTHTPTEYNTPNTNTHTYTTRINTPPIRLFKPDSPIALLWHFLSVWSFVCL